MARSPRRPALRLALFTDTALPQLNGVSRTLDRLAGAVRARGGAVRVFTTSDPAADADPDVVRVRSCTFPAYPGLRMAFPAPGPLARELRAWNATLVQAATHFGLGVAGRHAARMAGVPFVTSYHTGLSTYGAYYRLDALGLGRVGWGYLRWFHNGGLRTYCPTHAVAGELAERGIRDTALWDRGVDAERFSPRWRSEALRRRLGAGDGRLLVVYVGRLAQEKGLDVALEAMRMLHASAPHRFAFAVAGDGPHAAHCRARAPGGTTFVGQLAGDALAEFYASADAFVFPSTADTFGNVLLEAMASRLAVVAADSAPSREVLGGTGAIFAAGDAADLARTLVALDAQPERRLALAHAAHAAVQRRTWDRVFDALVADYHRLLGARLPAAAGGVLPPPPRRRAASGASAAAARR